MSVGVSDSIVGSFERSLIVKLFLEEIKSCWDDVLEPFPPLVTSCHSSFLLTFANFEGLSGKLLLNESTIDGLDNRALSRCLVP